MRILYLLNYRAFACVTKSSIGNKAQRLHNVYEYVSFKHI